MNITTSSLSDKSYKIAIYAIFALAVGMSLAQYLYNRSLWCDEAWVALNILNHDFGELLKPLDYYQVAPVLWLWVEKLFSLINPNSEYLLRLFPLLCFWASLYFFYKILKQLLQNKLAVICSFALFAFFWHFHFYASDIKQYMTDVMILTAIYWFTIKSYQNERQKWLTLGIAGVVAIFLSNVAPIILASVGLYVLYETVREYKKSWKNYLPVLVVFATWLAVFGVNYFCFIRTHSNEGFMVEWWSNAYGFLPLEFSLKTINFFYNNFFIEVLEVSLQRILSVTGILKLLLFVVVVFFCTIGLTGLMKQKNYSLILLSVSPAIIHLFLSSLQMYPVALRLFLYLFPCVYLLFGYGLVFCQSFFNPKLSLIISSIIFVSSLSLLISRFPKQRTDLKRAISLMIEKKIEEPESLFCMGDGTKEIIEYYKKTGQIIIDTPIIYATEFATELDCNTLIEMMKKRKEKVWLLFGRMIIFWYDYRELTFQCVLNELDSQGYKRLDEFHTAYCSAYLYDFGE